MHFCLSQPGTEEASDSEMSDATPETEPHSSGSVNQASIGDIPPANPNQGGSGSDGSSVSRSSRTDSRSSRVDSRSDSRSSRVDNKSDGRSGGNRSSRSDSSRKRGASSTPEGSDAKR